MKKIKFSAKSMQSRQTVSNQELKKVIADFLDMGHVENIVAMFRHEPRYYAWTGRSAAGRTVQRPSRHVRPL